MKINKPKLNLSIDILMFIVMIPIAGIGFLIKYVLVPGFKRNDIYGRDVELYYWGIDRHQWGTIHLYLSFILLFLLLLHIVFHWKQIVSIFKNMVSARAMRIALTLSLIVFTIIFGILPLFITPEIEEGVSHHAHHNEIGKGYYSDERQHKNRATEQPVAEKPQELEAAGNNQENHNHINHSEIEIYGYMTINEVAEKFNISAQDLAKSIGVPVGYNNEKLGRLRKKYGFQLNDLRDYVESKTTVK
ncbi:MAG: DUF4405 domain-containing protein [Bacteroidetes bacterium]|jgi:hypothetical protein|nr:DUF4405 domain-containing protein [Bacteroidota bacterium]